MFVWYMNSLSRTIDNDGIIGRTSLVMHIADLRSSHCRYLRFPSPLTHKSQGTPELLNESNALSLVLLLLFGRLVASWKT